MGKDKDTLEIYEQIIKHNDVVKVDENPDIISTKWGYEYTQNLLRVSFL